MAQEFHSIRSENKDGIFWWRDPGYTLITFDLIGEFFLRLDKRDKKHFKRCFLPLIRKYRKITINSIYYLYSFF